MELIEILKWPAVVVILFSVFRRPFIRLVSTFGHVEVKSEGIAVTLKKLEQDYKVSGTQIAKLQGLTGHDLWALGTFIRQPDESFKYVDRFNAERKAMVYSLIKMGLLEVVGEEAERRVQPTTLAKQVIEAADKLL